MDDARLTDAEQLLQEAVFAARSRQSGGVALGGTARCGLGDDAEAEGPLPPAAEGLLARLVPDAAARPPVLERLSAWAERQDQLDRDRNHYLKAFRGRHGFDRAAYAPATLAEYEQGLEAINARCREELRAAARALLGPE